MKTIVDKNTGEVLFAIETEDFFLAETETVVYEVLIENFENPHYNFETKSFYNKI